MHVDALIQNERDVVNRNEKIISRINKSNSALGMGVAAGALGGHEGHRIHFVYKPTTQWTNDNRFASMSPSKYKSCKVKEHLPVRELQKTPITMLNTIDLRRSSDAALTTQMTDFRKLSRD